MQTGRLEEVPPVIHPLSVISYGVMPTVGP